MTTVIPRDAIETEAVADVLIVGGGITGAAIAYEAASRGLSTVMIEKADYGGATSAATGKLIHGGLRYLKKFEIALVRESLAERRTLQLIAPGLVEPIGMVLPDPGLLEHVGLTAYDLLSADRNRGAQPGHRIPAHRSLSREELAERGLGYLDAGILFHDAMMLSPERLTLAFVRSAVAHGARVANYARVDRLEVRDSRAVGAWVTDQATGEERLIRASMIVNAAGPWAHDVLRASLGEQGAGPAPTLRSEGIYLVTRPITETMVLTVQGHGHFSYAPWRGRTLIGPTETAYRGAVEDWRLTRGAIETFLDQINRARRLPDPLTMDDVLGAYGGLRPLTETGATDTYTASRASELRDHTRDGIAGLVSANGGKYTNSRAFASKVVSTVARRLGTRVAPSTTATHALDACGISDVIGETRALAHRGAAIGLTHDEASLLTRLYGREAEAVVDLAASDPSLAARATDDGELLAGVAYAARHESVRHLTDIVLRRTGIGMRGNPGDAVLAACADVAARELGWDDARRTAELDRARAAVTVPSA